MNLVTGTSELTVKKPKGLQSQAGGGGGGEEPAASLTQEALQWIEGESMTLEANAC